MRKLIVVLIFLAVITPVFAQNNTAKSDDFYYTNVLVEKVYPTKNGYVVQYRSSFSTYATVGIPNEWFTDAASSAELVRLPMASDWPTMSVFFSKGQFSHLRLYIHPAKSHPTWGSIPQGYDVSKFFTDKESFKLEY